MKISGTLFLKRSDHNLRAATSILTDAEWDAFNQKNAAEIKINRAGPTVVSQGGDRTTKYVTKDLTNRVTI